MDLNFLGGVFKMKFALEVRILPLLDLHTLTDFFKIKNAMCTVSKEVTTHIFTV